METIQEMLTANKAVIMAVLKRLGVVTAKVDYVGCGDSGSIESVSVEPESVTEWADSQIDVYEESYDYRTRATTFCKTRMSLVTALGDFSSDWLEAEHYGWQDEDGSRGQVVFDVAADQVVMAHDEFYTETFRREHTL